MHILIAAVKLERGRVIACPESWTRLGSQSATCQAENGNNGEDPVD